MTTTTSLGTIASHDAAAGDSILLATVVDQAEAGQGETHQQIGASVATMLDNAMLVR